MVNRSVVASFVFFIILAFSSLLWAQAAANYLRQKRGSGVEDLLLVSFKESLKASKAGEWDVVGDAVEEISPALEHYAESFGIDLRPRLKAAVAERSAKKTVKILAQMIYFGIRDNLAAAKRGEDQSQSFNDLATARSYYSTILAGNIKRKKPLLHNEIILLFDEAQLALNNLGLDGNTVDTHTFDTLSRGIEDKILSVYSYFEK